MFKEEAGLLVAVRLTILALSSNRLETTNKIFTSLAAEPPYIISYWNSQARFCSALDYPSAPDHDMLDVVKISIRNNCQFTQRLC